MKVKIIFLFINVLCISALFGQETEYVLQKGGVNNVTIGMSVNDLYSIVGKENTQLKDLYLEGLFSPAIELVQPLIICEIECQNIWRIRVYDKSIRTGNGLGIGSTIRELREKYPSSEILEGEGEVFIYIEELKMSFALALNETMAEEREIERLDNIPETVKVSWILVL